MKPVIPVVSLLLLLLLDTTTQGIRLDKESLAAFHNNIHEEESSMGGVSKVAGVAPCGINGHCSGTMKESSLKEVREVHHKLPGFHEDYFGPKGHKPKHHRNL